MAKEPLIFATIVRNSSIKNGIASFVLKLKAIEGRNNNWGPTQSNPVNGQGAPSFNSATFPSIQTHYRSLEILQHIQTAGLWKVAANAFDIPRELSTITMVSAMATQQVNAPWHGFFILVLCVTWRQISRC